MATSNLRSVSSTAQATTPSRDPGHATGLLWPCRRHGPVGKAGQAAVRPPRRRKGSSRSDLRRRFGNILSILRSRIGDATRTAQGDMFGSAHECDLRSDVPRAEAGADGPDLPYRPERRTHDRRRLQQLRRRDHVRYPGRAVGGAPHPGDRVAHEGARRRPRRARPPARGRRSGQHAAPFARGPLPPRSQRLLLPDSPGAGLPRRRLRVLRAGPAGLRARRYRVHLPARRA